MPAGLTLPSSRLLCDLLRALSKKAALGESARVLLLGPPSGQTIETFHGAGCRVTVLGDEIGSAPTGAPPDSFDLLLAFDALDLLPDRQARVLAAEWVRVIRPGGGLYLLARQDRTTFQTPWRVDVLPEGAVRMAPLEGRDIDLHPRQNREIEDLVRPCVVRDIHLRRDGVREILCRKP